MRIGKFTASLLALGALAFGACSTAADSAMGEQPVEAAKTVAVEASPGPAIWKIADEDTTIYLFGTVHLLQKNTDWMTGTIENAWQASNTVYFETDVSPAADQAAGPLVMKYGMNPVGTTLSSYFNAEEIAKIAAYAEQYGVPMAGLDPMRPWLASLVISISALQASGADPAAGVEKILYERAIADGKDVRRFEELEQQLRFFADMDDKRAAELLLIGIDDAIENPDMFQDLVALWQKGDAEGLATMMNEGFTQAQDVFDLLLTDRNTTWVGEITKLMADEEGTFFIAVGAGHLSGPTSVTTQLGEAGITVTRQ